MEVVDKLAALVVDSFFDMVGKVFENGLVCDELHFCDAHRHPYARTPKRIYYDACKTRACG